MKKYTLAVSLVFLLSACTQGQAPVEYRGNKSYGQGKYSSSSESYARMDERYETTPPVYSQGAPKSATVSTVGESDLPPVHGSNVAPAPGSNTVTSSRDQIHVTDEFSSTPFNTPPSKPLEPSVPAAATPTGETPEKPADKIYDKDGITLIWPVIGGKVTSRFKGTAHDGINISISEGEPIVAAASGTVVYSGNDLKDYGNMVILRHDNSWLTAYANASRIVIKKGAHAKQGDIIAYVGSSGGVKTPQLHFSLRKGKTPVDPELYLPKN